MVTVSPTHSWPEPSGQPVPDRPWAYSLQLPHDPRAPRIARTTLRAVLGGHGMAELVDIAELLACELVTNAYRHSDGPSSVRLRSVEPDRLRVGVWDTNPTIPPPFDDPSCRRTGAVAADSDHGRGLLLVRRCADNWGGYPLGRDPFGAGGKLLWFELAVPGAGPTGPAPRRPCRAARSG